MASLQVLVVDDDADVCRVVESVLTREGIRVLSVNDSRRCLDLLSRQVFRVLFVDYFLSGRESHSVIRQGLRIRPQLAVVVFMRQARLESCIEARRLGACDCIAKPLTPERIRSSLARALQCSTTAPHCETPPPVAGGSGSSGGSPRPEGEDVLEELSVGSPAMREVGQLVARVASTRVPVLIQAENGVGKEGVAWAIHRQSRRAEGPFLSVSCGAIREDDLDRKFFGQGRRSRSEEGSDGDDGILALAEGGTLFLDDVDRLPLWAQTKLFDAIRKGRYSTVGAQRIQPLNVRLIAATSWDLAQAVADNRFDVGLYYYLNVIPIHIPPLRHRPQDIKFFVERFLLRAANMQECEGWEFREGFSKETWDSLLHYHWPGNLRELMSVVSRALLLGDEEEIQKAIATKTVHQHLGHDTPEMIQVPLTGDLAHIERHIVEEVIVRCHGNKAAAARSLGLHRRTLYRLLEEHPR